jgi:serine protease inhibitor
VVLAAAGTAMVMFAAAARSPKSTPFVVDRPFLFDVFDEPTGTILFVTRIVDPS